MIRIQLRLGILAGLAAILVAACGQERSAGGTSETENVILAVDSILPDWNRPAARTTIATLRLAGNRVDFSRTDSLGRDVAVTRLDGSPLPFEIVYWDKATRQGRIHVRIDTSLAAAGSMLMVSWHQPLAQRSSSENTWAGIPDSQKLAINSFLVDDFEDGNLRSGLPDSNSWFQYSYDSMSILSAKVVGDAKRAGRMLHVACTTRVAGKGNVLIQAALGTRPRNLRGMDSIVFWAKGSGNVSVAFTKNIPHLGQKAWKHASIDSNWIRIAVTPATFDSIDNIGGNVGWNAVGDSITHLGFFLSSTGSDLWLDDIRIYGIDRQDLE